MKHFRKFMEEVDSADEKSKEDRSEIAKKRFEAQKMKAKSELESTREKIKSSASEMEPPSFITGKKKKKEN